MKGLISISLALLLVFSNFTVSSGLETVQNTVDSSETLIIESVIETVERDEKNRATYKVTGTKTTKVKSGSTVLWTVTVTGTFEYDGSHSTCTAASVSTTCSASAWKISSKSASKSGSSATAKATGQRYDNGVVVQTLTESVTLVCGSDGTLY
ncbi:MAG: hypothetical protein U0L85_08295 [Bacilli bacterium]|nr:hypothetical protein [Bacilli bacterium]